MDLGVYVVGNDPLARGGIALLLSGRPGLAVLGQATAGEDWGGEAQAAGAQAVVLDCDELDEPGRERLKAARVPVVALVADAQTASSALGSGARGALSRDAAGDRLIAALEAVVHALVVTEERFSAEWVRARPSVPTAEQLTPREHEVLQLLAEGLPNKSIAARLNISDHTAKFHVNAILAKLGAETRTEAVVLASRLGWVVL